MYAASVEGLNREERAEFNDALRPPRPRIVRALPPVAGARPALRAVPDRMSPERLAAIRALGGDIDMGEGA